MAREIETLRLEIPVDAVDTVLAALGSLPVAAHIAISREESKPLDTLPEKRAYNPEKIELVTDLVSGKTVAAITRDRLLAADILPQAMQTRHIGAVWYELDHVDQGFSLPPSVLSLPTYFVKYLDGRTKHSEYALLAETAEEFAHSVALEDVRNIGKQAIEFYRAYVADLYVPDTDS